MFILKNKKMKNKKGQIAIFILFGIVILIGFGFIFYINQGDTKKNPEVEQAAEVSLTIAPIKNYVDTCIGDVSQKGIDSISLRGGYYDVINPASFLFLDVPHYFYLGNQNFPTKKTIENELSKYISNGLSTCLDNFETFRKIGYDFEFGEISVKSILSKTLSVTVNYPIIIKRGDSSTNIDRFFYKKDFDFSKLYEILSDFVREHQKNPDFVPIGYLSLSANDNNFLFDISYLPDNAVVYSFIFPDLFRENKTLIWNFASKYVWSEINNVPKKVKINPIPLQTPYSGYEFSYQVTAEGEGIKFADYSDLFDIDENTGLILFTPKIEVKGIHNVLIKAYDVEGNEDTEILQLDIVKENSPPTIEEIEDVEIIIGEEFNQYISANDADNDIIFYSVETSLDNFIVNPLTGQMYIKPIASQEGEYTLSVIATDTNSEQDMITFNMEIKNE